MERVFVLKSVRLVFTKTQNARFISHLDLTRLMARLIRKANLDIWWTEGFNPRPYITFALPLPLGFEGLYEMMDIRINDDNADISDIAVKLNLVCPESIKFLKAYESASKTSLIAFAKYEITFDDNGALTDNITSFLNTKPILCHKKTKKGDWKEVDLSQKIKYSDVINLDGDTKLTLILPSGPNENISPSLLLDTYFNNYANEYYFYSVKRTEILDESLNLFV